MKPNFLLSGVVWSVRLYQRTLSPDHGPLSAAWPAGVCRFSPTCSEYMIASINKEGWRGIIVGIKQLLHCHPYARS